MIGVWTCFGVSSVAEAACPWNGNPNDLLQCVNNELDDLRAQQLAVAFHVGPAAAQAITTYELVSVLDVRPGKPDIDTDGGWDRFSDEYVVPVAGVWSLGAKCALNNVTQGNIAVTRLRVNGAVEGVAFAHAASTNDAGGAVSVITYLNVGDRVTMQCGHGAGPEAFSVAANDDQTYLQGHLVGR
ncbi:MAG: hypothetical protein KC621_22630 [Myxococcales bacterium]|nr:hypothetical protein [Myxococcales bacterium]